ncbi:MAG: hypothetical protein JW730_18225 [Anaerolineales bacterium]|nr:hypothetical protein [Anaerolineales bacterium]
MPDYIGNIEIPEIVASSTFPIVPDYGYGHSLEPAVAVHTFGSGDGKVEQRFLLGAGAKRFHVHRAQMNEADRVALRNFWENKYGPYGAFTYNAPNDDGVGTTAYICRFADEPLSWQFLSDAIASFGVILIEIPATDPSYALNSTVTRFPSTALKTALLDQVQEIIPLVKIQPRESGYPAIYVSDRRCTIGSQLYLARLLEFEGISQSLGNSSDEARFTFGNADRVMRDLANDVDLYRAVVEFSLFHVGSEIKIDLWKGTVTNWGLDSSAKFQLSAADGLYELTLPYPTRKISRTCWKCFDDGNGCPFTAQGVMDYTHFPTADPATCDKSYDGANGCLAHGMKKYFGGIIATPQGVTIKDNSTGTWGFRRSSITSVSIIAETIYDQVVPEIYTDVAMPVACKIAAGREESDFYDALGIIGEGPLGIGVATGHTLDGQHHHGYPSAAGLRYAQGFDPALAGDFFSLGEAGDQTGGDWRKVFYGGVATWLDNFAAGTAFLELRRQDEKGLQLSRPTDHVMQAVISTGLQGWVWTAPGSRSETTLTNPIWIVVNMLLRALGLRYANAATAELYFDVEAAIAAAAICATQVAPIIGSITTDQFKFRGVVQEEKPLRDWIQEILMNCLGYYINSFGKLKVGCRINSSAIEAFGIGNILLGSLRLNPLNPSFNHLTANFGDQEFEWAQNSVTVYDIDHAALIGGATAPLFLKSNMNLSGTSTKNQAARIIATRLREELGGITAIQWKAARQISFATTVLALNVEPGMVCSMTHPDMPDGVLDGDPEPTYGEFRVTAWRLNKDYSIEIQGRTTVDEMYDLTVGPKPADVDAAAAPALPEYLNPAGATNLEVLSHREDPQISDGFMVLQWQRETENYRDIFLVDAWLSLALPAQGYYAVERAAFPGSVLEEGTCTVYRGKTFVPVDGGRTPDDSVLERVLVIYTDDVDPDSDLAGHLITAENADGFEIDLPFWKSGTYSYAVLKRPWQTDGSESSNVAYYSWPVGQVCSSHDQPIWRTPPIPIPDGDLTTKIYVTLICSNLGGAGTRLTGDLEIIPTDVIPEDPVEDIQFTKDGKVQSIVLVEVTAPASNAPAYVNVYKKLQADPLTKLQLAMVLEFPSDADTGLPGMQAIGICNPEVIDESLAIDIFYQGRSRSGYGNEIEFVPDTGDVRTLETTGGIDSDDLEIELDDTSGLSVGDTLLIDEELIVITQDLGANLLAVIRAQHGTIAAAHDENADVTPIGFTVPHSQMILDGVTDPLAQPTGLSAAGAKGRIVISWNAYSGISSRTLKHFIVYRSLSNDPETLVEIGRSDATYYIDELGEADTQLYYYAVSSVDTSGNESTKTAMESARQTNDGDVPTGVAIDAVVELGEDGRLNIIWGVPEPTGNNEGIDQVRVQIATDSGFSNIIYDNYFPTCPVSGFWSTAMMGVYYMRSYAHNAFGWSDASATFAIHESIGYETSDTAQPGAVRNFLLEAKDDDEAIPGLELVAQWDMPDGQGNSLFHFNLHVNDSGTFPDHDFSITQRATGIWQIGGFDLTDDTQDFTGLEGKTVLIYKNGTTDPYLVWSGSIKTVKNGGHTVETYSDHRYNSVESGATMYYAIAVPAWERCTRAYNIDTWLIDKGRKPGDEHYRFVIGQLGPGTWYARVRGVNRFGMGTWSSILNATIPGISNSDIGAKQIAQEKMTATARAQFGVFSDTFESGADCEEAYTYVYKGTLSYPANGVNGGKVLHSLGYTWAIENGYYPFDPLKLYRASLRARRTATTESTKQYFWLELNCYDKDKVYLGITAPYSANAYLWSLNAWTAVVTYYGGTGSGGTGTPIDPYHVPANTAYVRPVFILNYEGGTTNEMELDHITIEAFDEDGANRLYLSLASNGQINADKVVESSIALGAVTAGKITVATLSAIKADLGSITAGTVTGGTIQTAASGDRVVLDVNGLRVYYNNTLIFEVAPGIRTNETYAKYLVSDIATVGALNFEDNIPGSLDAASGNLNWGDGYTFQINGTQVLQARITGWTAPTGTATRSTFDTSTVTLENLAQRVKALIDDLITHGLIG